MFSSQKQTFAIILIWLFSMSLFGQTTERSLGLEVWKFKKATEEQWFAATVPGTVHTDLYANQLIPDPFYSDNEKKLQWIENEDWCYQTTFSVSPLELKNQSCLLQLEGLDTYAEVLLNGTKILTANNMFRTWKVDVKKVLKLGDNTLTITFKSAVKMAQEEAKKTPYVLPGEEKVFVRKAQYQFGWDWGPRLVTAGIYKPIKLIFWNTAQIEKSNCIQEILTDEVAKLTFKTTINCQKSEKYRLKINDKIQNVDLKMGSNEVSVPFEIKKPKRWWSNGLGAAFLYPFEITLFQNGKILSQKKLNIGLRTIELVQEQDGIGKSFYFKLNGVPVFMKGANYIPADSFLPRASDSVYKKTVQNAVAANMNMLRVWGGGAYADDAFYEACDQNGILVWQDFMFACAMYPGDDAFLNNVQNEVIDNVTRLQNHPCIALWCGNNENNEGWHNWGWQKQYHYTEKDSVAIWNDYQKLFHDVIPNTLNRLLASSENRYWPSSPSIGWGKKESLLQGDAHYWGVWWGKEPFEIYKKKVGRFMSEYGFQGMPNVETFLSFASKSELNFNSDAVKNHQKHPTGYATIKEYMERDYKVPSSFEDCIYVSQLLQAEGMKTAIEAHRRAMPNCMGSLFWQLNDCWPVTSWSAVDYYGRWKALQYQAKRSFENLLVSVTENETDYQIYVVNDDFKTYGGKFVIKLLDFKGKEIWNIIDSVETAEHSSELRFEIPKENVAVSEKNKTFLMISYKTKEGKEVATQYYFVKPKELTLLKPHLQYRKMNDVTIEITSDVLAKNVFLSSPEQPFFSDNYFDVLPNQKVIITISKPVSTVVMKSLVDTEN